MSVLGDVLLVPVILFLTLLLRFPLNGGSVCHRASVAATVTSWQHPVETGFRSLQAGPLGKWVTNQMLFGSSTIKYNKMRWDCLGTPQKTCTAINITPSAHYANALTTAVRSPCDLPPTQLGRGSGPGCSGDGHLRYTRVVVAWL